MFEHQILRVRMLGKKKSPFRDLATPTSEQGKFLLASGTLTILACVARTMFVQLGTQLFFKLLPLLMSPDQGSIKVALDAKTIAMTAGALLSTTLFSAFSTKLDGKLSSLYEKDFIKVIIEWEKETNSMSLYNSTHRDKPLDINKAAQAYAKYMAYYYTNSSLCIGFVVEKLFHIYLTKILCTSSLPLFLSVHIGAAVLNTSFLVLKQFGILSGYSKFKELTKAEHAANADLALLTSVIQKGNYSPTSDSLVPSLYEKLFNLAWCASSLSQPHSISTLSLDIALDFMMRASNLIPLAFSLYLGTDEFAKELGYIIVHPFFKSFNIMDAIAEKRVFEDLLKALYLLRPGFTKHKIAPIALMLPTNFGPLDNRIAKCRKVLQGLISSSSDIKDAIKFAMGEMKIVVSPLDDTFINELTKVINEKYHNTTGIDPVESFLAELTKIIDDSNKSTETVKIKINPLENYKNQNFCLKLPNGQIQAILEDQLCIKYGKVTAIKGASGCGKTMLLGAMTGHSSLVEGEYYRDKGLSNENVYTIHSNISPLSNTSWLEFITGKSGVTTDQFGKLGKLKGLLEKLKLNKFLDKLDQPMEQPSRGESIRMLIARAMFNKAKFIALDEAFSSVSDAKGVYTEASDRDALITLVCNYAREKDAAVVCIVHEGNDKYMNTDTNTNTSLADSIVQFKESTKDKATKYRISCKEVKRVDDAGMSRF